MRELTAQDLTDRFGPISLRRICFDPWPGTATEEDFLTLFIRDGKLYELVDGIILEKQRTFPGAFLSGVIATAIGNWVAPRKLGFVAGGTGTVRLASGLIRYPTVSFFRASRFPNGKVQRIQVPELCPDLAVEVLSPSNTKREMEGKRRDYFTNGTQLVWQVDPTTRTIEVFTAPDQSVVLTEDQILDGGTVLPGFLLPVRDIFADLETECLGNERTK